ncbi:hypothetical protein [Jiangella sp. DSM 45060]|uniref:hypothetical protein n=1 Tax=Jiangella sp. DSM 45060 TaxID=1798224 RepID=UPI00087C985E|nr:hypothetical protein [Jiangella sp. DSM 45060]SDT37267.1 hypothetical protein SAMN04515669_3764 [Jiangella sp. DSM 45060]
MTSHAGLVANAVEALNGVAQIATGRDGGDFVNDFAIILDQTRRAASVGYVADGPFDADPIAAAAGYSARTSDLFRLTHAVRARGAGDTPVRAPAPYVGAAVDALTALVRHDLTAGRAFADDVAQILAAVSNEVGGNQALLGGPASTEPATALAQLLGNDTTTDPLHRAQAWAWMKTTDQAQHRALEQRFTELFQAGAAALSDRLQWEIVEKWRSRRYDGMSGQQRDDVETAQARAWLSVSDPGLSTVWEYAYEFVVTDGEAAHDRTQLLGLWRAATGENGHTALTIETLTSELRAECTDLLDRRRARLAQAEAWLNTNYPIEHAEWRSNHLSMPDHGFEKALVHVWQDHHRLPHSADDDAARLRDITDRLQLAEVPEKDRAAVLRSIRLDQMRRAVEGRHRAPTASPRTTRSQPTQMTSNPALGI